LAERIEREQIAVAGGDQVRVAVDRQLEEFVVCRIAARGDPVYDRDQLGGPLLQPSARVGINQQIEVRAGQGPRKAVAPLPEI
jgi:hypothetical protein